MFMIYTIVMMGYCLTMSVLISYGIANIMYGENGIDGLRRAFSGWADKEDVYLVTRYMFGYILLIIVGLIMMYFMLDVAEFVQTFLNGLVL